MQDDVKDTGVKRVSAFVTGKTQNKGTGKGPRCYECNQFGHVRVNCPRNKQFKHSVAKNAKKSANTNFAALSFNSVTTDVTKEWFLDSGVTLHLAANRDWIKDFIPESQHEVRTANGTKLASTGYRIVSIPSTTGYTMDAQAQHVAYVPDLTLDLLSLHKMVKQGDRSVTF